MPRVFKGCSTRGRGNYGVNLENTAHMGAEGAHVRCVREVYGVIAEAEGATALGHEQGMPINQFNSVLRRA